MIDPNDYQTVHSMEGLFGNIGKLGIRIQVAGDNLPDLTADAIGDATYRAIEKIKEEITAAIMLRDATDATKRNRAEIMSCFEGFAIYVKEIPNGYCNRGCCRHLPWFIVTTPVGHFTIGWRKRVINIDWSDTIIDWEGEELFPDENVTKGGKYIHAWSVEDARRYVHKLVMNAKKPTA